MIFEPVKTRNGLCQLQDYFLSAKYEQGPHMGNVAASNLHRLVDAWLVGFQTEFAPVLPRSLEWLDVAIQADEVFGTSRNFHRLTLHWAKAVGLWMRDGVNVPAVWDMARQYCAAALEQEVNVWPSNLVNTNRLDDYMAFCFQAEQYEIGIAEFEKCCGVELPSLRKKLKPRQLGYALCLHRGRGQFNSTELFDAGRRLLQANLEEDWLGRGQALRAATWLKIVYWHHDQSLSPLKTISNAYEDMPKVPRPEFLSGN